METTTTEISSPIILEGMKGIFVESLRRNNKKIREDRALQIAEAAEMKYKRRVEDLTLEIKQLKRDRDGMLDLSPTNADSLVLATDFNADSFVQRDLELGLRIRNLEIALQVASERYAALFS